MMIKHKFLKKWDLLLFLAVAALCGLWFLVRAQSADGLRAVIYQNGTVVQSIDLSSVASPCTIELFGNPSAVLDVERGRIRYHSASCPDRLCVSAGWLSHAGDTAACLPGKSMILLTKDCNDLIMTY